MQSIEELHHDYILISKMKIPIKRKCRLLTELLAESSNPWRVIGITTNALNIFIKNNFNRVPRMGINRAHLKDRNKIYTHLFENIYDDPQAWWNYYYEHDKTILSTSSENMKNSFSNIIQFETLSYYDSGDNLFKNSGFSWSYSNKKEKPFLQKLAAQENI